MAPHLTSTLEQLIISLVQDKMPHSSSILALAETLICTTALDIETDPSEPYDLCKLRENLAADRESLQRHIKNPDSPYASYLGLDGLYWKLCFSWADLQDFVEEANCKLVNEERGFRSEWLCVKELADGSIVPDRPRIHRHQTLADYALRSGSDEFPVLAWEEEDYEAATWPSFDEEEEEERIPWEDYDQDDLNKMDRQPNRGY
jgi:hypothetical protein